ncbi:MAG: ribonuclease [Alphaproteobacteria bacterium]|nr:ribonuclease [Alphaproteobacteria bacterium]
MEIYPADSDYDNTLPGFEIPDGYDSSILYNIDTGYVSGVNITDQKTGQTYQGIVDLNPTLDRIAAGQKYPYKNDGTTFNNYPVDGIELLPSEPSGYYTECVVPTPGINGPGPQRIVVRKEGEAYYTPDHYHSFIPIKSK